MMHTRHYVAGCRSSCVSCTAILTYASKLARPSGSLTHTPIQHPPCAARWSMRSVPITMKTSNSIPKRDMLPSSRPDQFTKALDDAYERGFMFGRAAGVEHALKLLRDANITNI